MSGRGRAYTQEMREAYADVGQLLPHLWFEGRWKNLS
jgi:hypothetical protein